MAHPEWEVNFLVVYDKKSDTCTCLKCDRKIETVKKYTLQKHCERVHPDTKNWSTAKKSYLWSMKNTRSRVFGPKLCS